MKIIEVNKLCEIDQENIAPCRDSRRIAVNVTQHTKDEKGFINYCLAIDDYAQCYEEFSAGMIKMYSVKDDEVEGPVFVTKIIHNADTDKKWLEKILQEKGLDKDEIENIIFAGKTSLVFGKDEELLVLAYVYNQHNGYYCHEVYTTVNGKTEVTYL